MTDDEISRSAVKRDLKREVQRLLPHIDHVGKGELKTLDRILDQLEQIHTSEHACKKLCTENGLPYVPWGTKYAPWWERFWKSLNQG